MIKVNDAKGMHSTAVIALACVLLVSCDFATADIVNGDFATGDLTGWTAAAIDGGFNPIPAAPYVGVNSFGAGNAVQFSTGVFDDGLFLVSLEQSFTVDPSAPILTLDFALPATASDPTGTGLSEFLDALFVAIEAESELYDLLLVDQVGPLIDPFGTAPGAVTLDSPSDPAFDHSLRANLSLLIGQSVTLILDVVQEDDGFQLTGAAVSNIRAVVPEPSTLIIALLLASGMFGKIRWRRR